MPGVRPSAAGLAEVDLVPLHLEPRQLLPLCRQIRSEPAHRALDLLRGPQASGGREQAQSPEHPGTLDTARVLHHLAEDLHPTAHGEARTPRRWADATA